MFAQVKLMIAGKFEEFHKKLNSQTDLEFRMKTAVQALKDVLPLDFQNDCKNSQLSDALRKKADQLFFAEKGNIIALLQACEFYSRSIALAEMNSRELPLAYANRSAILYNLKKYVECIRDINKALELNYPDVLRPNLIRRKAKCLKLLGKPEAEDVGEEARRRLQNINLDDESRKQLEEKIKCATKITELSKLENNNLKKSSPNLKYQEKIPCASTAIDIKYDKKYGKHIVATCDINVGEILVIEKPYAGLLKSECIYTHCSQCFNRAWDSIPCLHCVNSMYCSEKCRNKAWEQYHDIECPIKGYFTSLGMNDLAPFSLKLAILAIRQAGGFTNLKQNLSKIDRCEDHLKKCFSDNGSYQSDVYKPLYCLETHETKRFLPEVVSMTMNVAVILYFVSTLTSFFGEKLCGSLEALSSNDDAIFMGGLMAHHYMMIQMNNHELTEIDHTGHNYSLGAVIFSLCSLFNHSCNPNVTRIPVVGDNNILRQVIVAQHSIKKGNQLFDDYGFDFTMETASKRKDICNKYHFTCECKACKENWPSFANLPSIFTIATAKDKKIELKKAINKIAPFEKIIKEADVKILDADSEKTLSTLAQTVTILFKFSSQPTKELYKAVLLFRQAFLLIHGNRFRY